MRYDNQIICLKEEADSSSINQAYDKFTAKEDKRVQRKTLPNLRQMVGIVDQWGLVHSGLAAVRNTKENPEIWINSFRAVNLDPTHQIPFLDWIKKIESFIQSGDSFKSNETNVIDEYLYLPSFWHAMLPEEKKQAFAVVERHDCRWSPSCVQELKTVCSVSLADMHLLQTCISLAIANPGHLNRGFPTNEYDSSSRTLTSVEEAAETTRKDANHGLKAFQLKPEGFDGEQLFEHMIGFRKRHADDKILGALAVDVDNPFQKALLSNEPMHDKMNAYMKDIGDGRNKRGARVMNALGGMQGQSELLNNPERLQRMKSRAELMKSLESIKESKTELDAKKKREDLANILPKLPGGVEKFKRGENITVDVINGILVACYDISIPKGKKKPVYLDALTDATSAQPEKLDIDWVAFSSTLTSQISAVVAATAPAAAPSNDDEQIEFDVGVTNLEEGLRIESL